MLLAQSKDIWVVVHETNTFKVVNCVVYGEQVSGGNSFGSRNTFLMVQICARCITGTFHML